MQPSSSGVVVNGNVLIPGASAPEPATLIWRDGVITEIAPRGTTRSDNSNAGTEDLPVFDAGGAYVLPGIIDVHGDAFERCLMPRAGVPVHVDVALVENDAQLLAAGITTSFLSATDSWEPGLRSRETLRDLVAALGRRGNGVNPWPGPDVLLHVRHERCQTEDLDELVGWIESGAIQMFSYNDHTDERISTTQLQRSGMSRDEFAVLTEAAIGQREVGRSQERELAVAAAAAGCVTASHDASTEEHLARDLDLGVRIAEFPLNIPLARRYQAEKLPVLLGAPNLVRGGSHIGNLSVQDALEAGSGDLLCSDYHYPSLLQAPFVAIDAGLRSFADAWALVSSTPAAAAGLSDRGRLEAGARADVIIVDHHDGAPARVSFAAVAGRRVMSNR